MLRELHSQRNRIAENFTYKNSHKNRLIIIIRIHTELPRLLFSYPYSHRTVNCSLLHGYFETLSTHSAAQLPS